MCIRDRSGAPKAPAPQPAAPNPGAPNPAAPDPQQGQQPSQQPDEPGGNQARLGYQGLQPLPVPHEWSDLVPAGPPLAAKSAAQPQNA